MEYKKFYFTMLKFFRRIRKSLVYYGSIRKYLLYAAGEIALVVIGILIAVQINNWSNNIKANTKEKLVLQELIEAIEGDFSLHERTFYPMLEKKKLGIDSMLHIIGTQKTIHDSVFIELLKAASTDIVLNVNNGPFEALKTSGPETIKNIELRNRISEIYQRTIPSFIRFTELEKEANNPRIRILQNKILAREVVLGNSGWRLKKYPSSSEMLYDQRLFELLELESLKHAQFEGRLKLIRNSLQDLHDDITLYLESK